MSQKDLSERGKYIIFDNHMHLNPEGRFLEAVDMFLNAGGTSFNLVNLPDNKLGIEHLPLPLQCTCRRDQLLFSSQ